MIQSPGLNKLGLPYVPVCFALAGDDEAVADFVRVYPTRAVLRTVDASRMRTRLAVFAELALELQFPDYFGHNWDALDECLTDLSWMPAEMYVLVIRRAGELLADEPADELGTLVAVFETSAAAWADPKYQGRPRHTASPIPFHVVLQDEQKGLRDLRARFIHLGRTLGELAPG